MISPFFFSSLSCISLIWFSDRSLFRRRRTMKSQRAAPMNDFAVGVTYSSLPMNSSRPLTVLSASTLSCFNKMGPASLYMLSPSFNLSNSFVARLARRNPQNLRLVLDREGANEYMGEQASQRVGGADSLAALQYSLVSALRPSAGHQRQSGVLVAVFGSLRIAPADELALLQPWLGLLGIECVV